MEERTAVLYQRPSVVLPLFLISSPSPESRRLPKVNTRLSTKEISGMGPEEIGIFHFLEVLDSLANWESTQSRESGFSNRPRNPS